MSSRSPDLPAAFLGAPIAHRGLHDRARGVVENSRAAAEAASSLSAPQADLRGSVEFKKHLAGVLVTRGLRQALSRLGVQA